MMSYPSSGVTLGRVCYEGAFPLVTDKLNSAKPSRQGCGHQIMAAWSLISMEGCTLHTALLKTGSLHWVINKPYSLHRFHKISLLRIHSSTVAKQNLCPERGGVSL